MKINWKRPDRPVPGVKPPTKIITPKNVKRTVAPAPVERFAVSGPVIGGFASLGVGRYLESEEEWRRRFGRAA